MALLTIVSTSSDAATICTRCVRPVQAPFVAKINHATTAAYAYTPVVNWSVNPNLRLNGPETYADRRSPEFNALQRENAEMKAWIKGVEYGQALAAQAQTAPTEPYTGTYATPQDEQNAQDLDWKAELARQELLTPEQPPAPRYTRESDGTTMTLDPNGAWVESSPPSPTPAAPNPEPLTDESLAPPPPEPNGIDEYWYPTWKATCSSCHTSGGEAEHFPIDGTLPLRNDRHALDVLNMMKAVWNGTMPPNGALDDETMAKMFHEFLVTNSPEPATPPQSPNEGQ